jgi:AcrR family transcriptional regulator
MEVSFQALCATQTGLGRAVARSTIARQADRGPLGVYDRSTVCDLPVVQPETSGRADAIRNRARILTAAERLFTERGAHATTMDAIAAEAGVGKGTLFRRFGDRASLVFALLDQTERDFQDAILRGPPPLGPGASPGARLIAFGEATLDRLERDGDLLLEIEGGHAGGWQRSQPYAVMWLHARTLIAQGAPRADGEYLADVVLAALSPAAFHHQRHVRGLGLDRLKAGFDELVTRMLGAAASPASDAA